MSETVPVGSCPEGCMSQGGLIGDRCHCGAKLDVREMTFGGMIGDIRAALYDQANAATYRPTAKVLGWQSPWNGDEHTGKPRSYWPWIRLYVATRKARHLVGIHDWSLYLTHPPSRRQCTWCGRLP